MSATHDTAVTYHLGLAAGDVGADALLTAAERHALARIDRPERRGDWLAGVVAAKRAVALATGEPRLARIEIRAGWADGATAVLADDDGTRWPADVSLALTRRRGRGAAVAARPGQRVGVRIECDDAIRPEHVPHLLSPAERGALDQYDPVELWALKSAAWSALAADEAMLYGALELRFDTRSAVVAGALHDVTVPLRATVWRPWPGFVLAIVVEAGPGLASPDRKDR